MGAGKDLWNQYEALFNQHDWAGLASLFASDAVLVGPLGRHEGSVAITAACDGWDKAFPDIRMETSLVIERETPS
jgi:hypothetical protein